mmetsp:Transcript_134027/g.387892  ORF Transcript_134027/g.387892 Transcript_134027/m.387892 type:complete len:281 (+) Transcript_134027:52-894(+)
MSLHCPGLSGSTFSLNVPPNCAKSCSDIQPKSPHIAPPFCEVGQSEWARHNSLNFFPSKTIRSFTVRGGRVALFRFCRRSFKALRKRSSASWWVRATLGFAAADGLTAPGFAAPSVVLSMMWRSRMLPVTPNFDVFAFFAAGCASGFTSFGGRKQTCASSRCEDICLDLASSAVAAIMSPHAARGCILNSAAAPVSSSMLYNDITEEAARSKKGWLSGPSSSMLCTSGVHAPAPPSPFLAGSPSDPLLALAGPPNFNGCTLPSTASASHALHRPSVAMKA